MSQRAVPVTFSTSTRMSVGRDHLLNLLEIVLDPLVLVLSQWAVALSMEGRLGPQEVILSLIVFSLTFPGAPRLTIPAWRAIRNITLLDSGVGIAIAFWLRESLHRSVQC